MPRGRPAGKREPKVVTDEEILKSVSVEVELAAKYIEWTPQALRAALREKSIPVGSASQPSGKEWSYNIMSEALVKYRHGEIQCLSFTLLQNFVVESAQRIIDAKLGGLSKVLELLLSA